MALTSASALRKDTTSGLGDLQHRHFATIATILRNIDAPADIVEAFADQLRGTNPKFDRKRFLAAVREA